jgi:large subunit ribosomal protein L6
MSRIGKKPVDLASGVTVQVVDGRVVVEGPKGQLEERLVARTRVVIEDGRALVHRDDDSKRSCANHGLMRSLLANMVTGVTNGFAKRLEIVGVGYRAEVKERQVSLNVGYSHLVLLDIPEGIDVTAPSPTSLVVEGISKQKVGQFASEIRRVRKPEPYKGKGIRYADEHVRRKVGKAAVGG